MRAIRRVRHTRPAAAVVPFKDPGTTSKTAAWALAVLCVPGLQGAWGATAAAAVTPGATVAPAAAVKSVAAGSWKSVLDPLSAGGWAFISDGPPENPSAVYASTHNVLHDGNVVTAWMRWEFSRPQAEVYPLHYLSAVTREQLDCDARTYRRSAVFYYLRNNLQEKGPAFTALNDDTNWKAAIPGSEADAMLSWGCTPAARTQASTKASIKSSGEASPLPGKPGPPLDKASPPPGKAGSAPGKPGDSRATAAASAPHKP